MLPHLEMTRGDLWNLGHISLNFAKNTSRQLNLQIHDNFGDITDSVQNAELDNLSKRITDWLAAPNPSSNSNSARDEHQPETGLWLLENSAYLEWKDSPSSLLWLHSKAGCGKTILSSTVIHDLSKQDPARPVSGCIYFYFDFQIHEKQLFEKCLCSLLVQLIGPAPNSVKVLKRLYNAHSNGGCYAW